MKSIRIADALSGLKTISPEMSRGAVLLAGAALARQRGYKTGSDYLYCLLRKKLSFRQASEDLWEGAAVYVAGQIHGGSVERRSDS